MFDRKFQLIRLESLKLNIWAFSYVLKQKHRVIVRVKIEQ